MKCKALPTPPRNQTLGKDLKRMTFKNKGRFHDVIFVEMTNGVLVTVTSHGYKLTIYGP